MVSRTGSLIARRAVEETLRSNISAGFTPLERGCARRTGDATRLCEIRTASRPRFARPSLTGFTLLEMIAVVIIVGVLASTLIPMVGKTIEDSRKAKAQSDTKAIVNAIGMYKMTNGSYPPGSCGGCIGCGSGDPTYNYAAYGAGGNCGVEVQNSFLVEGTPKFLAKRIGNDPWGSPYPYHIYTRVNPYMDVAVFSIGPNKSNESWSGAVWNTGTFNGDDIGAFFDAE